MVLDCHRWHPSMAIAGRRWVMPQTGSRGRRHCNTLPLHKYVPVIPPYTVLAWKAIKLVSGAAKWLSHGGTTTKEPMIEFNQMSTSTQGAMGMQAVLETHGLGTWAQLRTARICVLDSLAGEHLCTSPPQNARTHLLVSKPEARGAAHVISEMSGLCHCRTHHRPLSR